MDLSDGHPCPIFFGFRAVEVRESHVVESMEFSARVHRYAHSNW